LHALVIGQVIGNRKKDFFQVNWVVRQKIDQIYQNDTAFAEINT
jgi:hypothetical protein